MADETYISAGYFAGGTLGETPTHTPDRVADVVGRFMSSTEARNFQGWWVAIDKHAQIVDRDLSPTALSRRLEGRGELVITFVSLP